MVDLLESLRNDVVAVRNRLSDKYSDLPPSDPRRMVARHLKAVVSSSYLVARFLDEDLCQKQWWEQKVNPRPSDQQVKDELDDLATMIAFDVVVGTYSYSRQASVAFS